MVTHKPDGQWYLADSVLEHQVAGERDNLIHTNTILMRAADAEAAYVRAQQHGVAAEASYLNQDDQLVTVRFRGLAGLFQIYDDLADGAEILYREDAGVSEATLQSWLVPKAELAVFQVPDPPDPTKLRFVSKAIMEAMIAAGYEPPRSAAEPPAPDAAHGGALNHERTCIAEGSYAAITYGRRYAVLGERTGERPLVRVVADNGRRTWIPSPYFDTLGAEVPRIHTIEITDDLADQAEMAIEVTVHLTDGTRRWCFFATPAHLLRWGESLAGTTVPIQYGTPHQIIVSVIDEAVIHAALDHIQRAGELLQCTLPLSDPVDQADAAAESR